MKNRDAWIKPFCACLAAFMLLMAPLNGALAARYALVNKADATARAGIAKGTARPPFRDAPGVELLADPEHPNAAVAYDEEFLLGLFAAHGLRTARPVMRGHWSGQREAENFQDLLVLEKGSAP